jgi:cytidylate kinase
MKRTAVFSGPNVSHVAERQMRSWAIGLQTQQHLAEQKGEAPLLQGIHPYVAISREAGIDDAAIANLLAAKTHWKVLGRDVLDYMAEQQHWSRTALDFVDEKTASWFNDTIAKWLDRQTVSQVEFVHRLARVLVLAAQHESMIFAGRGAQFVLPRDRGLTVRLIAPRKNRIHWFSREQQLSEHDAQRHVDEVDAGREAFVKRYFHRDLGDPRLYDLVINLEHMTRDAAAELIYHSWRLRFLAGTPSHPD